MKKKWVLFLKKVKTVWPVLLYDGLAIPLAWVVAYSLRYNLQPFPKALPAFYMLIALCLLIPVQSGCYYYYKIYRGLWRFASLNDVIRILKASIAATLFVIPLFYLAALLHHIPRSVFPLYSIILIALLCGGRLMMRAYCDKNNYQGIQAAVQRVLIVGAGVAGESLVRDLKRYHSYKIIGFVDDDEKKCNQEVHGVRVLGTIDELASIVHRWSIDLIFIAIPTANSASMRTIVGLCEESKVPFRTLPGLSALIAGRVEVNALRPVHLDDLLGRDQVRLDWDRIVANIVGKRILVTGGGGSIGSELCRQIMALKPLHLHIIDNCEYNLYQIEQELHAEFPDTPLDFSLISVTDGIAIDHLFAHFKPEVVFHAAAYKHVPLLQNQVRVAVQNNVLGTEIVAKTSVLHQVSKFILISTDKAVNPTNIMGTTKRVAEIYCQNLNTGTATQFITVRFGNVLGSAGSVVPLFQKQLQMGGPITVTHPDIERYFMTIPEACQLILQAMACGNGGEIFVLDMGEPIKVKYLAEQMIRLAGKEPDKDINIVYTGLRPGEKLYEELFHASEQLTATDHEKLFKAQFRVIDWDELTQAMRMIHTACMEYRNDELLVLLKNLVPEFELNGLEFRSQIVEVVNE